MLGEVDILDCIFLPIEGAHCDLQQQGLDLEEKIFDMGVVFLGNFIEDLSEVL